MENEQSIDQTNENQSLDSILGTFKDVESLKKSYDNLRSEFTRKSQELSRLNKLVGDKEQTPPNDNDSSSEKEQKQDIPFWEKDSWQKETAQFFDDYSLSDDEKLQLAQILVQDKEVEKSVSPLHCAYIKLIKQSSKNNKEMLKDEDFLNDNVYNNEQIKAKIIENYLKDIKNRDSIPVIMPNSAANFGEQSSKTPKTLSEAKQLASKYFD